MFEIEVCNWLAVLNYFTKEGESSFPDIHLEVFSENL